MCDKSPPKGPVWDSVILSIARWWARNLVQIPGPTPHGLGQDQGYPKTLTQWAKRRSVILKTYANLVTAVWHSFPHLTTAMWLASNSSRALT